MLYFAYGSNMRLEQMQDRCPGCSLAGIATLDGYRLVFPRRSPRWGGGVAGIERAGGSRVEGVLYDLTLEHLKWLDGYEGVPDRYDRTRAVVRRPDGSEADVITYVAHPEAGGPFAPSSAYRDAMVDGARAQGLSPGWIATLEEIDVA